jgi:hypothetical protein
MNPEAVSLITKRMDLHLADARREFAQSLSKPRSEMVDRGVYHSSIYSDRVRQLAEAEFARRASLVWESWRIVVEAEGLTLDAPDLADVRAALDDALAPASSDVQEAYHVAVQVAGVGSSDLSDIRLHTVDKVMADAEVYSRAQSRRLHETAEHRPGEQRPELIELKPGIWGISLNLKAVWRRITAWWKAQ